MADIDTNTGTDMEENFDIDRLQFNADGLIPAIAQDYKTGEVLMMAWMNRESLEQTLASRDVVYWSRSRGELWAQGCNLLDTSKNCTGCEWIVTRTRCYWRLIRRARPVTPIGAVVFIVKFLLVIND